MTTTRTPSTSDGTGTGTAAGEPIGDGRPLWVTPTPTAEPGPYHVPGVWFDQAAVDRVVAALGRLRHTKGRWAGTPLVPAAWQLRWILAPVFGWKHPDGTRVVREVWIEVPRKAGKSTLASGLALVLLLADREPGAEVYAAASTRDQARMVFDESRRMVQRSTALKGKAETLASVIRVPATGGIYRVLSRVAEAAHGLNVSGAVVDEVHVHKSRDLVDAIATGTGAREQPLVIYITTADEGEDGTIYAEKHDYTLNQAKGLIPYDPTHYGVIWAAPDEADPFDPATWAQANPGLGVSPKLEYLEKEAGKARSTPSYWPTFARLHLNRRIRQTTPWLKLSQWDASAGLVVPERLRGRECWAGLDLSAVADLTTLQLVFPDAEHERLEVLSWFWLPEADLLERVERDRVPYDVWTNQGYLTLTEGNAVDYDIVEATILDVAEQYQLQRLSYDRMMAGQLISHVGESVEVAPVPQTFAGMSPAAKELERLVIEQRLRHGGHPILRWNVDCVEVLRDNHDNIKPVKPKRHQTSKRVDGVHGLCMALDGWMRRPQDGADEAASW